MQNANGSERSARRIENGDSTVGSATNPGAQFLASYRSPAGRIRIGEVTEDTTAAMLDDDPPRGATAGSR